MHAVFTLFNRLIPLRVRLRRGDPRVVALVEKLIREGFNFRSFEDTLHYRPRRWEVFLQSLLHRSYLQFVDRGWSSNERLEFLGDSILNAVVAEYLFKKFPEEEEGALTKLRARLVNRKILAVKARELRLSDFLLLSHSAAQSIGGGSESILADAFEAIIAAIYSDGGIAPVREFVHRMLLDHPDALTFALTDDNYKSALLEFTQGRGMATPRYTVVKEEGPEHDRRFTIEVTVGSAPLGIGTGRNKKDAEQAAAAQALERLQREPQSTTTHSQSTQP